MDGEIDMSEKTELILTLLLCITNWVLLILLLIGVE
jgi:hypothetical protein